jgi:isopentenyl diphosphate isomerase/L-lactate dehydrogenase-like FMN-dependent dehydrogenase
LFLKGKQGSGLASYVASLIDRTLTWKDIAWLRQNTTLKIVVKGVMTVEDALASVRHGVDGTTTLRKIKLSRNLTLT